MTTPLDQLILALVALVVVFTGLLPTIVAAWSHVVQSRALGDNGRKLDTVVANTNGAAATAQAAIISLRAEVVRQAAEIDALKVAVAQKGHV